MHAHSCWVLPRAWLVFLIHRSVLHEREHHRPGVAPWCLQVSKPFENSTSMSRCQAHRKLALESCTDHLGSPCPPCRSCQEVLGTLQCQLRERADTSACVGWGAIWGAGPSVTTVRLAWAPPDLWATCHLPPINSKATLEQHPHSSFGSGFDIQRLKYHPRAEPLTTWSVEIRHTHTHAVAWVYIGSILQEHREGCCSWCERAPVELSGCLPSSQCLCLGTASWITEVCCREPRVHRTLHLSESPEKQNQ